MSQNQREPKRINQQLERIDTLTAVQLAVRTHTAQKERLESKG